MNESEVDLVLWPACVRTHSFQGQIAAAEAGGFPSLAITISTYNDAVAAGLSPGEMLSIAADRGVVVRHLDAFTGWAPVRVPLNASSDVRRRFDFSVDECLAVCDRLHLQAILAFPGFDPGVVALPALVDGFGALCDRAAPYGIRVDLEFAALSGLPNLATAWTVVRDSGRENCGVMLDTWHFLRGEPDFDLLHSIPSTRIVGVQLADSLQRLTGRTLLDDNLHYRMLPGEGELGLLELLAIVRRNFTIRHVGPEVFADALDVLLPEEAGRTVAAATRRLLTRAGIETGGGNTGPSP